MARRASLSPSDSLFAALLTGLNPRFIVLAPTFMTDVSSLFFLMGSLYGFVRAVEAAGQVNAPPRRVFGWLAVGMLCGVLGGTIRQTVWFAPLAGATVLFLWPGVGLRIRLAALLCGVMGLTCIVVGIRWFNSQPYAIPTRSLSQRAAMAIVLLRRRAIVSAVRRMPAAILVPLVYLVPYSAAVMQASNTTGGLFDRYYLPCVPVLACAMLFAVGTTATSASERRSSVWGWVWLAIGSWPVGRLTAGSRSSG